YGAEVKARAERLAQAGFGLAPRDEDDGFLSYPWLPGRALSPADLGEPELARIAAYCAFRAEAFPSPPGDPGEMLAMLRVNFAAEFGGAACPAIALEVERPVL